MRIEDLSFATRTLFVRGGKGGKDGVGFFGSETAHLLRVWLAVRTQATLEDYLFLDRRGHKGSVIRDDDRPYGRLIETRDAPRGGLS